jgi:hypothetical protein
MMALAGSQKDFNILAQPVVLKASCILNISHNIHLYSPLIFRLCLVTAIKFTAVQIIHLHRVCAS